MPIVRECADANCNTLTMGTYCIDHDTHIDRGTDSTGVDRRKGERRSLASAR